MGNVYNRLTGEKGKKGSPFGWAGLPEPPSTSMTDEQQAEATEVDQDLFHQFGTFLGSLLQGVTAPQQETLPTPKTPDEAMKLKPGTKYRRPDGKEMVR
jgi:hypothetical protein